MSLNNIADALMDQPWPPEREESVHLAVMEHVEGNLLGDWKRREVHRIDENIIGEESRLVLEDVGDAYAITWISQGGIDTVRHPDANVFEIPPAAELAFSVSKAIDKINVDPRAAFTELAVQAVAKFDDTAARLRDQVVTAVALDPGRTVADEFHLFLVAPIKSRMYRVEADENIVDPSLTLSIQCRAGVAVVWR